MSTVYGANQTTYANILKKYYKDGVDDITYPESAYFEWIPKKKDFQGSDYDFTVKVANNQSISNMFANTVQPVSGSGFGSFTGSVGNSQLTRFTVSEVTKYATANISTQIMRNSMSKVGGIEKALTEETDDTMKGLTRDVSVSLTNPNGNGVLGVIASYLTSGTFAITLADPNSVVGFEVGMFLELAPSGSTARGSILNPGGGAINSANPAPMVSYVDRVNGLLYVSTSVGGSPVNLASFYASPPANGALVARVGNMFNDLLSVASWLPGNSLSSSDSFLGVNRNIDSVRLAGQWFDGTALTVVEALIEALNRFAQNGGFPDTVFCNFKNKAQIEKVLQGQVRPEKAGEGEFGFSSLLINGPRGDVRIIADNTMPNSVMYALKRDVWELKSAGDAVGLLDDLDSAWIKNWNDDSYQLRIGGYMNQICHEPVQNGVIYVTGEA